MFADDGIRVNRRATAAAAAVGQLRFDQNRLHLRYRSTCSPLVAMAGIARLSNPAAGMRRLAVLLQ